MREVIDGLFNRELSWAYGGEIGFRPSVSGGEFYMLVKLVFPIFVTKLTHEREAFRK